MKECPNKQSSGNLGNRAQSLATAPQERVAPRGATFGTSGGANASMQSLAGKSMIALQVFSVV